MGFREMRGGDGVSDVEIRRNEIIELLYTYKKYSIDDFAKRFGVSRRTINYDIVYLMDFYEIDTKPGPHGGISLIDRRPNSHTAYLKPIKLSGFAGSTMRQKQKKIVWRHTPFSDAFLFSGYSPFPSTLTTEYPA